MCMVKVESHLAHFYMVSGVAVANVDLYLRNRVALESVLGVHWCIICPGMERRIRRLGGQLSRLPPRLERNKASLKDGATRVASKVWPGGIHGDVFRRFPRGHPI